MRFPALVFLLVLLSGIGQGTTRIDTKVYGGKDAPANEWPWMAAILDSSVDNDYQAQFCAGSLITPQWILSAAHCLHPKGATRLQPRDIRVLLDTIELCKDCTENRRSIDRIIIHPDWNTAEDTNNANDIALLRLSRPINNPGTLARASIIDPQRSAGLPETGNDGVQVLGWGSMFPESEDDASGVSRFPTTLQQVALDFVDLDTCKDFYDDDGLFSEAMICAHEPDAATFEADDEGDTSPDNPSAGNDTGGTDTFGEDTCRGDSGGPLFREAGEADWLAGITSWGYDCGDAAFPGVYTEVLDFVDWIERQTKGRGQVVDMTGAWRANPRYASVEGELTVDLELINNARINDASAISARVEHAGPVSVTDNNQGDSLDCNPDGSASLECTSLSSLAARESVQTPLLVDHIGLTDEQVELTLTASAGEGDYRSGNDRIRQTLIFSDKPDLEAEFGTPRSSGKTASIPLTIRNAAPHQDSGNLNFSLTLAPALQVANAEALNCDTSDECHPGDPLMAGGAQQYSLELRADAFGTHALAVRAHSATGDFPDADTDAGTSIRFSPEPSSDGGSSGGAGLVLVLAAYARRKKRSIS